MGELNQYKALGEEKVKPEFKTQPSSFRQPNDGILW